MGTKNSQYVLTIQLVILIIVIISFLSYCDKSKPIVTHNDYRHEANIPIALRNIINSQDTTINDSTKEIVELKNDLKSIIMEIDTSENRLFDQNSPESVPKNQPKGNFLIEILKNTYGFVGEQVYYRNMLTKVKISQENLPWLNNMINKICSGYGMQKSEYPDAFVVHNGIPDAYVSVASKPQLLIHSALLDLLTCEELLFILSQKIAQIPLKNVVIRDIAFVSDRLFEFMPYRIKILQTLAKGPFYAWTRKAEMDADRMAFYFVGSSQIAIQALLRINSGISKNTEIRTDGYFKQLQAVRSEMNKLDSLVVAFQEFLTPTPFLADRIVEIYKYDGSVADIQLREKGTKKIYFKFPGTKRQGYYSIKIVYPAIQDTINCNDKLCKLDIRGVSSGLSNSPLELFFLVNDLDDTSSGWELRKPSNTKLNYDGIWRTQILLDIKSPRAGIVALIADESLDQLQFGPLEKETELDKFEKIYARSNTIKVTIQRY